MSPVVDDGPLSWWARRDPGFAVAPPPTSPVDADVVVVGGGLAGLNVAITLRRFAPELDVVLLEGAHVGAGASGRAAGFLVLAGCAPWLFDAALPAGEARWAIGALRAAAEAAVAGLAALDGGVVPARQVLVAPGALTAETLRWASRRLDLHGIRSELLDPDTLRDTCGEAGRLGLAMAAWGVDPWRTSRVLREEAVRLGVRLFEGAPVSELAARGGRVEGRVAGVGLRARHCVVAAGARTLGLVPTRGDARRTWMMATPRLPDADLTRLGRDTLVVTLDADLPYRRIVDGHLLFGGLDDDARAPLPAADTIERRLRALLARTVPGVSLPPATHVWGGAYHQRTPDDLPHVAEVAEGLTVIDGVAGSGLLWGLLAGRLTLGLVCPDRADPDGERLRRALVATRPAWWARAYAAAGWGVEALLRGLGGRSPAAGALP